ncbi:MAG: PP2C family protein-serine/threonine phosphatase [Oscillospiraceae bacterium]
MKYAYICERGGRAVNEDSVLVRAENGRLAAAVADGLGGCGGGKNASETAVNTISDNFDKLTSLSSDLITEVLEQANRNIILNQTGRVRMKSTVAVLAANTDKRQYIWAYIGDSRLYHFVNGRIISYTKDHSVSQLKAAMGEITEAQIRSDIDRNRLVRALGAAADRIKPSISSLYTAGDRGDINAFLLCSDGFWQYVLEEEMEETLRRSHSPDEWLGAMAEIHSSRSSSRCDNYSAIVLTE